ncbi:MAG: glycosyltransferase family 4 protein [Chthonomonadetes bacterium]|nr:glycosyltransferase family 4 protein [Chthonomonadetes bacterium]
MRKVLGRVDLLVVYAPSVAQRYSVHYGVPCEKTIPLKFHHTLSGFEIPERANGDYIFAGGDSKRNYDLLLQAVRDLPCKVFIATRKPAPSNIPSNVTWRAVEPQEFRQLMAGSQFVVLPLDTSGGATSGQQSYLNAMALGKLVIVTDTEDASYYIEHGVTGILVPSGDADELRRAIVWALSNSEEAQRIGSRAREVALPMDQEWTFSQLLEFVEKEARKRGYL